MNTLRLLLRRPPSLALLALNFLLLGSLLGSLAHPWRAALPPATAPEAPAPVSPAMSAGSSLNEDYAALIARPVFHSDRIYTPPPKVETVVAQTPAPDFLVTGFMAVAGRPGKAFLHERAAARAVTVTVGDSVDGWTVTAIAVKQVELRQGERRALLTRSAAPVELHESTPASAVVVPASEPVKLQAAAPLPMAAHPAAAEPGHASSFIAAPAPAPATPVQPPPAAPQAKSPPPSATQAEAAPEVTLSRVIVTRPHEFGPPMLVEPRGPLLTYVPPEQPGSK